MVGYTICKRWGWGIPYVIGGGSGGIPYVVSGWGGVVQGKGVCWYLKFENNSTIQHLFDDQTTFHIISLMKMLDSQFRFSFDDMR